jgi:pimeloyl-ACP methyl ester carboxylesterase
MSSTIILAHGAFAESASWNGVLGPLREPGHRVIAFATPLRSVASDAAALSALVQTVEGPVLLVGHSYGGAVITNVDPGDVELVGLVYVAGFALAGGEGCGDAASLAPGSTLADTLLRVPSGDGRVDTYIDQDKYHHQFAADLPGDEAALMAMTQRPVIEQALFEPSGPAPLWREVPSWFIWRELDHNIPAESHRVMAERAAARRALEIQGASHVVGITHPRETAALVLEAAQEQALASS